MMYLIALLLGGVAIAVGSSSGSADAPAPSADDDVPVPAASEEEEEPVAPPVFEGVSDGSMPDLADSAYNIGWGGLSPEEQLIVELINRARMDPAFEVDRLSEPLAAGISSAPVEALAVVPTLSHAARDHSQDMDDREFFDHTDPDGGLPWDRAQEAGHANGYVGENIGLIWGATVTDPQARAEAHHHNLWDSDGHQANLMSGNWSEIGVGYDYGDHSGSGGATFVTELFGDTGQSYLTGVVIEDEDGDEFYDIGEGQGDVRITAFNDEGAYATSTWDAGGYSLALPPGTYTVVFEGGELDAPYETEVTIGSDNVKLDVLDEGGTSVMTLSAVAATAPEEDLLAALMIDQGDEMPVIDDDVAEPELVLF
ncbi:MAG: hypothetical protein HKN27_09285 [Silicimonas sp.]|nr:hypothetical protein [Silicimonas sp.]